MGLQLAAAGLVTSSLALVINGSPLLSGARKKAVAHHAAVLVLEVMAVVHEKPGLRRRNKQAHPLAGKNTDRVFAANAQHPIAQLRRHVAAAALDDAELH